MYDPMKILVPLLAMSVPLVPFLIIYLVGMVLSILRWRSHPTRSRLALIAFALYLARLFGNVATNWLTIRREDFGWDTRTFALNLGIIHSIDVLVAIVAWILLLIALFSRSDLYVKADLVPGGRNQSPA